MINCNRVERFSFRLIACYFVTGYDPDDDFIEELSHFVVSTCWIQGFYIYRELHKRNDDVAYFGITRDIDMDGFLKGKNELCKSYDRLSHEVNNHCEPMTKTFYQQVVSFDNSLRC